ncbi:unnamed protein product [Sympodiomycopsis kandeliae]
MSVSEVTLPPRFWASILRKSSSNYHQVNATTASDATESLLGRAINEPSSLNGHGIFAIIVFACVTLIVIHPVRIPIPYSASEWIRKQFATEDEPVPTESLGPHREPSVLSGRSNQSVSSLPKRYYLTLNHVSTPIIGILLLLASKTIGGEEIKLGIVGDEGVEPYDVLALFISLAYIAISVDATGLLRYLAFHVSLRGGRSGPRLFFLLYLFFFLLGLGVGNDPVILSGTAFLVYFTRIAGLTRPDAWIWAQFAAANISSATLVSSNPTNLVIASGGKITFPVYSAFMALPTVVSGLVAVLTIRVAFINRKGSSPSAPGQGKSSSNDRSNAARTDDDRDGDDDAHGPRGTVFIPPYLIPPDVNPRSALVDPFGAVFGTVVMGATLAVLISTSVSGHVKVFQIALPGAALCLIRDAYRDLSGWRKGKSRQEASQAGPPGERKEAASQTRPEAPPTQVHEGIELQSITSNSKGLKESASTPSMPASRRNTSQPESRLAVEQAGPDNQQQFQSSASLKWTQRLYSSIRRLQLKVRNRFPTISLVAGRLPFPLLPFAFGMFILVQSLAHVGFVKIMASGLGKVCGSGSEIGTAFFIGFLSVFLCSLGGTNIGACILLVRAFQEPTFMSNLPMAKSSSIYQTALYSLALGSNIGALGGTFSASLAGLLWRGCLKQGGIIVHQRQFLLWSLFTTPLCLAVGLLVVWAQIMSGKWPS